MMYEKIPAPEPKPKAPPVAPFLDACDRGSWYLARGGEHYELGRDSDQALERYRMKLISYAQTRGLRLESRKYGINLAFCIMEPEAS